MARKGMDRFMPRAGIAATLDEPFLPQRDRDPEPPRHLIDIRILELLTARLCHELSGPIAAINNGVELVAEEEPGLGSLPNPAFLYDPVALIRDSARRARSQLQFYRFAYGFTSGSATAGPAPHEIAIGFFAASRIIGDYADSIRMLSADWQKLACNLLSVGADALPRGGRLVLTDSPFALEAVGEAAALSPEAREALTLATPITELNARTVQPYFTGLLAQALDRSLIAITEPGRVRVSTIAPSNNAP
jgi:histidine phosphotransferase ChpT